MLGLRAPELIVIALIILLLFGYKKLPDTARSIGESLKIFKKSVRDDPAPTPVEPRQITGIPDKVPPHIHVDGKGNAEH